MVALLDRANRSPATETHAPRRVALTWGHLAVAVGLTVLIVAAVAAVAMGVLASASPSLAPGVASGHLQTYATNSTSSSSSGVTDKGVLALAASIAIAGGLIGTGMAQSGIGASGMGIIAERPEKFGKVLVFFVIPETLWILGFVLGILLLLQIL